MLAVCSIEHVLLSTTSARVRVNNQLHCKCYWSVLLVALFVSCLMCKVIFISWNPNCQLMINIEINEWNTFDQANWHAVSGVIVWMSSYSDISKSNAPVLVLTISTCNSFIKSMFPYACVQHICMYSKFLPVLIRFIRTYR